MGAAGSTIQREEQMLGSIAGDGVPSSRGFFAGMEFQERRVSIVLVLSDSADWFISDYQLQWTRRLKRLASPLGPSGIL